MGSLLALAPDALTAWLVLARLLPLGLLLAIMSRDLVPRAVSLSLTLALTATLLPVAGSATPVSSSGAILAMSLRELAIGGVFALSLSLALSSVGWAVRLTQSADSASPVDTFARVYVLCAAWLVLSLGGLRAVVIGLAESFRDAPLGGVRLDESAFALGTAQLLVDTFAAALGFALPLLVSVWLLELALALLARVSSPSAQGSIASLRPLIFFAAAALLLVPVASSAPDGVRAAIVSARALTRALAK